jgi:hypothetical protein
MTRSTYYPLLPCSRYSAAPASPLFPTQSLDILLIFMLVNVRLDRI